LKCALDRSVQVCFEEKPPLMQQENGMEVNFDKPEEEPPNWHYW